MRSELISAELYDLPTVLVESAGQFLVACGNHIMTHTLKSAKLLDCSEALPVKPKRMVQCGSKLVVSGSSCSMSFTLDSGSLKAQNDIGQFEVLSSVGPVTVVLTKSSDNSDRTLGYVEGELSSESKINVIYTGFVGKVSQSSGLISAIVGSNYRTVFVYDLQSKSSREFRHDIPMTSIAAHPLNEEICAGDKVGKIVRFSMNGESNLHYAYHHWHSVPVASLQYSSKGSVLLSGAEEGVVCIWNNATTGAPPQFIPHLGGPIAHITTGNQYAVVSLRTNKILVIDMFTRQIQSTLSGTVHETNSGGIARVSPVDQTSSTVAITTSSHCQLFDTESRKTITKSPIPIQNRNYIPTNLRQRVSARPWECDQIGILHHSESVQYLLASLSRRRNGKKSEVMVKFFASKNEGQTWNLESVCMHSHNDVITHVATIPALNGFITVCRDGSIKQWQLVDSGDRKIWKIVRTCTFKNQKNPSFVSVSEAGLVVIGFGRFITLWDPIRLVELSGGSLTVDADSTVVAGGLIEGTTELFTLSSNSSVDLWNLCSLRKISSVNIGTGDFQTSPLFTVVENRLLIASELDMISITRNDNDELVADRIVVSQNEKPISSICRLGNAVIVATNKGKSIWKLSSGEVSDFRVPDEDAQLETTTTAAPQITSTSDDSEVATSNQTQPRRVFQPLSALISKLFPLENELDSLPSPETSFDMLARGLLVASK